MRKKRHLFKKLSGLGFLSPPRKPARQSDKTHEGNIYADEQRGLFRRTVKEQLLCSSFLMVTKNKTRQDSAKRPHAAKEAAPAAGVYTGEGALNEKQMKSEAPAHKITNPRLAGAIAMSNSTETPLRGRLEAVQK